MTCGTDLSTYGKNMICIKSVPVQLSQPAIKRFANNFLLQFTELQNWLQN